MMSLNDDDVIITLRENKKVFTHSLIGRVQMEEHTYRTSLLSLDAESLKIHLMTSSAVDTYTHILSTNTLTHKHNHKQTNTQTQTQTNKHTNTNTNKQTQTQTQTQTHTNTHKHTHTHTHKHTHKHTYQSTAVSCIPLCIWYQGWCTKSRNSVCPSQICASLKSRLLCVGEVGGLSISWK